VYPGAADALFSCATHDVSGSTAAPLNLDEEWLRQRRATRARSRRREVRFAAPSTIRTGANVWPKRPRYAVKMFDRLSTIEASSLVWLVSACNISNKLVLIVVALVITKFFRVVFKEISFGLVKN
jgi:hypothetical protein